MALENGYEGDPWERQPDEPEGAFARFEHYRNQVRGKRRYSATAHEFGVDRSWIKEQASRWKWRERCALWDSERSRQANEAVLHHDVELAEHLMSDARAAEGILRRSLAELLNAGTNFSDSKDLIQLARLVVTLRDASKNAPDQVIEVVNQANTSEEVDSLAGLSDEQRKERVAEMARGLLTVVDGGKAS